MISHNAWSWNIINICFATPCYRLDNHPTGGLSVHYRWLAQGLAEKGHEITVLYADRFGNSTSIPKDPNIKFIPVRFRLPKIFQTPVVGRIINYLGLTELIRFQEDSKLISRSINFLQLEKPFDVIESPSNGATLYRYLTSINSSNCMIRIATTDKKHSSINSRFWVRTSSII